MKFKGQVYLRRGVRFFNPPLFAKDIKSGRDFSIPAFENEVVKSLPLLVNRVYNNHSSGIMFRKKLCGFGNSAKNPSYIIIIGHDRIIKTSTGDYITKAKVPFVAANAIKHYGFQHPPLNSFANEEKTGKTAICYQFIRVLNHIP